MNLALNVKPKMYNLWYGKQCHRWCGVNYKLKQWKLTNNSRCLNCNGLDEDAERLMIFSNKDKTRLFKEHVGQVKEWMKTHYIDPDLANLVVEYLNGMSNTQF